MNREKKLKIVINLFDFIAKLDDSFWIDKSNLTNIYYIFSTIDNEEFFDIAYKNIIEDASEIISKVSLLNKKIDKINKSFDERVNQVEEEKELSLIEKQFNF